MAAKNARFRWKKDLFIKEQIYRKFATSNDFEEFQVFSRKKRLTFSNKNKFGLF